MIAPPTAVFVVALLPAVANAQNFDSVQVRAQHEAGGVHMLVGAGGNVGLVVGDDAVFVVDPQGERKVAFTQWGTGGVYSTGEVTFDGEMLVFRNRLPDGTFSDVRSLWRRTPEGFTVTREREVKGKGWDPILEVRYRRQG